jgi:hypothetical protein
MLGDVWLENHFREKKSRLLRKGELAVLKTNQSNAVQFWEFVRIGR